MTLKSALPRLNVRSYGRFGSARGTQLRKGLQAQGSICIDTHRGCVDRGRCGALSTAPLRPCWHTARCAPAKSGRRRRADGRLDSIPPIGTSARPHGRPPGPRSQTRGSTTRTFKYTHRPTKRTYGCLSKQGRFAWLSGCPVRSWLGAAVSRNLVHGERSGRRVRNFATSCCSAAILAGTRTAVATWRVLEVMPWVSRGGRGPSLAVRSALRALALPCVAIAGTSRRSALLARRG
jgi:hypothetical protein